ncbi:MAG: GDYXXLXY domain-containing protein [Methylobacterium sp.]|uniref:GDYXXLXY domain-containing protein n=1 Tax=Methylobacterium sp. TaxID=409 RepID=UPI00258CC9CB|nr:GDYXXLXY domain-containing protein [Methylobacterium sp.]MBY0297932.1 GDYXXLXY domain-containing protein [Methylobacterium sp.]
MIGLPLQRAGRRGTLAAFALVFLVQAAPSIQIALDQSRRLASGRPVLLATATKDPRDLFRGEYSILSYEAGQPAGLAAAPDLAERQAGCDLAGGDCRLAAGTPVHVTLRPGPDGLHHAASIAVARPAGEGLVLRGTVQFGSLTRRGEGKPGACAHDLCFSGAIAYGIERWYGPQGVPANLDTLDRGRIRVRARVGEDGIASLDAILIDGEDFARTPRL